MTTIFAHGSSARFLVLGQRWPPRQKALRPAYPRLRGRRDRGLSRHEGGGPVSARKMITPSDAESSGKDRLATGKIRRAKRKDRLEVVGL